MQVADGLFVIHVINMSSSLVLATQVRAPGESSATPGRLHAVHGDLSCLTGIVPLSQVHKHACVANPRNTIRVCVSGLLVQQVSSSIDERISLQASGNLISMNRRHLIRLSDW